VTIDISLALWRLCPLWLDLAGRENPSWHSAAARAGARLSSHRDGQGGGTLAIQSGNTSVPGLFGID
jgi:hypothetical protein